MRNVKVPQSRIFYGVGLILFNTAGQILTLKELQSKPLIGKKSGMISFPLETVEHGETYNKTLRRLLREEIGINIDKVNMPVKCGNFMHHFDNCTVYYQIYMSMCFNDDIKCNPEDDDVVFNEWLLPDVLIEFKNTRVEVGLFLKKCLDDDFA